MRTSIGFARGMLVPTICSALFVSALSLSGCGGDAQTVGKSASEDNTISSVAEMPDRLADAMEIVPGCRMTIEQSNNVTWTLRDGDPSVGSVSLNDEDETVTILIDEAESDVQAERMAHMLVASVLACNPSYEYDEAQEIAYEALMEDECRDNGINYVSGTKGDRFVLVIEL